MFRFASIVLLALIATSATAYNQTRSRHSGGTTWTLCSAETTDDAVCDDGTTDRAAAVAGFTTLLFDSSGSSSTNYACDIYGADHAVAEAAAADLSSSGFQMNSVSLSQTAEAISFSDMPVSVVWIKCGTIGDSNSVTITVTGSN